jgi:hypothetical protein
MGSKGALISFLFNLFVLMNYIKPEMKISNLKIIMLVFLVPATISLYFFGNIMRDLRLNGFDVSFSLILDSYNSLSTSYMLMHFFERIALLRFQLILKKQYSLLQRCSRFLVSCQDHYHQIESDRNY